MSADAKLQELNLSLPPAPKPAGVYKPVVIVDKLVYVSGHGPLKSDGTLMTGRVARDLDEKGDTTPPGKPVWPFLATLRAHFGTLDKLGRLVKTLGMVNSTPEFQKHPAVINGFSELMAQVFGPDQGVGARSAVGMGSLPGNIAVEVEAIFELN